MASPSLPALVIDSGSLTTRAGISGVDSSPSLILPSRGLERGNVTNWQQAEALWRQVLDEAQFGDERRPLLLTEAPLTSRPTKEKTVELMFERFAVPELFLGNSGVLSLYASGGTTGIVVGIGHGVTYTVPVQDGYVLQKGVSRYDFAGIDLTASLRSSLGSQVDTETAQKIKESLCYVAEDFNTELELKKDEAEFSLPDGETVSIGRERYTIPELLFEGSFQELAIHEILHASIGKCDIDTRKALYGRIVLSGGTTLLPRFTSRLQKELAGLMGPRTTTEVKIVAPESGLNSVWIGGSLFASMDAFRPLWISKAEYEEAGAAIVHQKCP